jgi:hypothetical protein
VQLIDSSERWLHRYRTYVTQSEFRDPLRGFRTVAMRLRWPGSIKPHVVRQAISLWEQLEHSDKRRRRSTLAVRDVDRL